MSQYLAPDDAFTEGTPVYGDWLSGYMRYNPWESLGSGGEAVTGYTIRNNGVPTLHDAYGFVTTTPQSIPAAFKSNVAVSAGATPRVFSACLWRPYVAANAKATLAFVPHAIQGTPNSASWSYAGVCVRASGSPSYNATAGSDRLYDGSGYWLILANSAGLGCKWLLLRVVAGAVTLLDSVTETRPAFEYTSEMSLSVTTTAGNPVLTATTRLYTSSFAGYPVMLDGTPEERTIFTYTDANVAKITASGRCGFGTSQEFFQSSGAIRTVTLIPWFQIYDTGSALVAHRDEWVRASPYLASAPAADTLGFSNRSLMAAWSADTHGAFTRVMARDVGNNRITVASPGNTHIVSTRRATNIYTQDRSVVFNIAASANPTVVGLTMRASWPNLGAVSVSGYRFVVTNTGAAWSSTVYRIRGDGVQIAIAQKADISSFGLATGVNFTLQMAISNVGGASEATGIPTLTCTINGTSPVWTNLAGIDVDLPADDTIRHVGATADLLSGACQGIVATPGTSATFDTWTDTVAAVQAIDADEMAGISIAQEGDGATGTLVLPYDWPVEEETIYRVMEHEYDSGHLQLMPWNNTPRRRWKINANAITQDERDDLKDFYDAHDGAEIPFTWVEPNGDTITAHFVDDTLDLVLKAPSIYGFGFSIEELDR